jgi:hypothetical protein
VALGSKVTDSISKKINPQNTIPSKEDKTKENDLVE